LNDSARSVSGKLNTKLGRAGLSAEASPEEQLLTLCMMLPLELENMLHSGDGVALWGIHLVHAAHLMLRVHASQQSAAVVTAVVANKWAWLARQPGITSHVPLPAATVRWVQTASSIATMLRPCSGRRRKEGNGGDAMAVMMPEGLRGISNA